MQASYGKGRSPFVGFVILSHAYPDLLWRLIDRLGAMFDAPPIVCHHDTRKTPLNITAVSEHIRFVQPPIATAWGEFSCVRAVLTALAELYALDRPPQWCFVLSGQDYPIKPAWRIICELESNPFDVWMHSERISPGNTQTAWQARCVKRYLRVQRRFPYINRHGRFRFDRVGLPWRLSRFFVPFTAQYPCYAGSFWITINRKSAEVLLRSDRKQRQLERHYAHAPFPEESYFQTILENERKLCISRNDRRFIDWRRKGAHPEVLTEKNLGEMTSSAAWFARKMEPTKSHRLLDQLDVLCMEEIRD